MIKRIEHWYLEWIPRVSNLVEFIFPFNGDWKKRYFIWLHKTLYDKYYNSINIENRVNIDIVKEIQREFPELHSIAKEVALTEAYYLAVAQDLWTSIHKIIEDTINNTPNDTVIWGKYIWFIRSIESVVEYIQSEYKDHIPFTEFFIIDKKHRFQGTIDLILVNEREKKVVLFDWKTWGIAKVFFDLPDVYKKPYDKLKKLKLQLSLYASYFIELWYEVELYGVRIREENYYIYPLEVIELASIEEIVNKYIFKNVFIPEEIHLTINYSPMRIEVQTVLEGLAYSKAWITLETTDIENFKSPQEAIDFAVMLQKYLCNSYK